ncbi:MAG: DNA helicase Rep [bacterium]
MSCSQVSRRYKQILGRTEQLLPIDFFRVKPIESRATLRPPMPSLNPQQQAAIDHTEGPLLVLAGAGSGKTRVITHKIAHLIRKQGLQARHIAAVTFTNKAAREMKSRVQELMRGDNARGLRVSTFHTLGLDILRREQKAAGLRAGFTIMDQQDGDNLIKELLHEQDLDKDVIQQARWQISNWKNQLVTPEDAISRAESDIEQKQAVIYEAYQRTLGVYNAVDFDDLIMRPVQLFANDEALKQRWQSKIRYLLVDEYQDTNGAQYELVRQLVGIRGNLTVVGDDDQSIYAWRGAQAENLVRLREDFHGLKVIKLEQNYRSTKRILHAANTLIKNNPHVFEKRLWSDMGPGDILKVMPCPHEEAEAEQVVSEIVSHRFQNGRSYGEYAILYRSNHQSRIFEKQLRTFNVPYRLSGGTSFFAHTEIKDLIAYLRLLANPDDDAALLRIINTPKRGIGPGTVGKLVEYATAREIPLLSGISEIGLEQHLANAALGRLREFAHWIAVLAQLADENGPLAAANQVISDLDYHDWLQEIAPTDKAAERKISNVVELLEWLKRLQDDIEPDSKTSALHQVINRIMLMDMLDREDEESDDTRVSLMTLHAAKGLEFPHVFLVGMEEEILPHHASIAAEDVEEERRLAYVGITRARQSLTMTYAKRRRRGGENVDCEPSRFLEELPSQDLEWQGKQEACPETQKARGNAHLANLKAMLG